MTESDATGQFPEGEEPRGPDSAAQDPDGGPASEPTGAREEDDDGEEVDQDAGPASEPGAAQGGEPPA